MALVPVQFSAGSQTPADARHPMLEDLKPSAGQSLLDVIGETVDYARDRKAFGKSILDNQTVHFKLAEMQTEVELLRSLIYRAGEQLVAGVAHEINNPLSYILSNVVFSVEKLKVTSASREVEEDVKRLLETAMAALDRELDRGGRLLRMFDGLCRLTPFGRARSRRHVHEDGDDEMVTA